MVTVKHSGDFRNLDRFFTNAKRVDIRSILAPYGKQGVQALAAATPKDTGETASSWGYEIVANKGSFSLVWANSNMKNGIPIAILLQYGHATRSGAYVQGVDYINPALRPIFDAIAEHAWREVTGR